MIPTTLFSLILFATCMQEANCCTAWLSRKGRAGAGAGSGVGAAAEGESFDPLEATRERMTIKDRVEHRAGWTPLHLAAYEGNDDEIRRLIREGDKVDADSNDGCTPLFIAAKYGHFFSIKALINAGANVNTKNYYGESPRSILYDVPNNDFWRFQVRFFGKNAHSRPLLHQAVLDGDLSKLNPYLESKMDEINVKDDLGYTALMLAVIFGHRDMVDLLAIGGNINEQNKVKATALHYAAQFNECIIAQILIRAGATIDALNHNGATPLIIAAYFGYVDIVKALLAAEADIFIADNDGQTALSMAIHKKHNAIIAALTAGESSHEALEITA